MVEMVQLMKLLIKCKEPDNFLPFWSRLIYTKARYTGGVLCQIIMKIAIVVI